ncbi:MAG: copper chaperone PCu(A)C [Pseudomonadota bacterium]
MLKHRLSTYGLATLFFLFIVLSLSVSFKVTASDNGVEISDAWARATFATAKTGAGYFKITNNGEKSIALISASVSETVATMVELHETVMADGMMQMRELEDGIPIAVGETVVFQPGGRHLMFLGLSQGLTADTAFDVTLSFSDETVMQVNFVVKDMR